LIIKVENSERNLPPPPFFSIPLDLQKTLKLLGASESEDKKPVNKKSRIGTHPSKVQGK
jgi:hypothetical protein